jgi:uncharacterized membrane protein YgcG
MRYSIFVLVLAAAVFSGCTSAYKTGQTPDDVYYSPERQHDEYVNVNENDQPRYYGNDQYYYDDQYLRMKVHNRIMWSDLDDYYFYNPRYSYSYYSNWNNPWSPYTYWNYFYNPYCSPVIISSKTSTVYNHPRIFNLNTYNSTQLTNNNYTTPKGRSYNNTYSNYNYSNNRPVRMIGANNSNNNSSNTGNFLRNIFNGSSNNSSSNNSSFSNPGRSSSGSSSSGSSGSSGSTAPVRKF